MQPRRKLNSIPRCTLELSIACIAAVGHVSAAVITVRSEPIANSVINAATVDAAGNIYLTGVTYSGSGHGTGRFQATRGAFQEQAQCLNPVSSGCPHAFVVKLDPAGKIVYATFIGGSDQDVGVAITVDNVGNAYVAGSTYSADFPVTADAFQKRNAGPPPPHIAPADFLTPGGDIFFVKLNAAGTALLYATLLGGAADEVPSGIARDMSGDIYIAGSTFSGDFPVTSAGYARMAFGKGTITDPVYSGFITKFTPAGAALYSTYFDGPVSGIAVDSGGAAYITGSIAGALTTTNGAFQTVRHGPSRNAFVAKLRGDGVALVYSTYLEGDSGGEGRSIAVDSSGTVWITGWTALGFPVTVPSVQDVGTFLAELNATASTLLFSTLIAGSTGEASTVLLDSQANPVVFGRAFAGKLETTGDALEMSTCFSSIHGGDNFITKWDRLGSLTYSTYSREGQPLTIDSRGNVYVAAQDAAMNSVLIKIDFSLSSGTATLACVQNGASFVSRSISPGEIVTIEGDRLGPGVGVPSTIDSGGTLNTELAGTKVFFNNIPSPLLYVQAAQINAVVPFALMPGSSASVVAQVNGVKSSPLTVVVHESDPGIFGILNEDGTVNSLANRARLGSTISIFGTGTGLLDPVPADGSTIEDDSHISALPVKVVFGDVIPAQTTYAGNAPGQIAGLIQINVVIPDSLPADIDKRFVQISLQVGDDPLAPRLTTVAVQ